jgi:hypothetical protein
MWTWGDVSMWTGTVSSVAGTGRAVRLEVGDKQMGAGERREVIMAKTWVTYNIFGGRYDWHAATGKETIDRHGLWWKGRKEPIKPVNEEAVAICERFLSGVKTTKSPRICSYTAKHIVEHAVGTYIANGDLLVAARRAGVPLAFCDWHLNGMLFLSKRDLRRRAEEVRRAREEGRDWRRDGAIQYTYYKCTNS